MKWRPTDMLLYIRRRSCDISLRFPHILLTQWNHKVKGHFSSRWKQEESFPHSQSLTLSRCFADEPSWWIAFLACRILLLIGHQSWWRCWGEKKSNLNRYIFEMRSLHNFYPPTKNVSFSNAHLYTKRLEKLKDKFIISLYIPLRQPHVHHIFTCIIKLLLSHSS